VGEDVKEDKKKVGEDVKEDKRKVEEDVFFLYLYFVKALGQ